MKKIVRRVQTEEDRIYLQSIRKEDLLFPREERELLKQYQTNPLQNREALEKLMRANEHLVRAIATSYASDRHSLADLMKEGRLGLEMAIKRFNRAQGFRFSFFAAAWIRKTITQAISKNIHPELLNVLIPSGVQWTISLDEGDVRHLLEGNKFTRYQMAGGENIAEALSCFKPEKFHRHKECKLIVAIRLKKPYYPAIHELQQLTRLIRENIPTNDIRWGIGFDQTLPENVAITIAAAYKTPPSN